MQPLVPFCRCLHCDDPLLLFDHKNHAGASSFTEAALFLGAISAGQMMHRIMPDSL